MNEHPEDIEVVKETIDKERSNLFTVIAALSFLCVCLVITSISLVAITADIMNERSALSVALDDQRTQYYYCIRDEEYTTQCDDELVSPASRDIRRDLDSAGFGTIINGKNLVHGPSSDVPDRERKREAFGLLGYIVYGDSE